MREGGKDELVKVRVFVSSSSAYSSGDAVTAKRLMCDREVSALAGTEHPVKVPSLDDLPLAYGTVSCQDLVDTSRLQYHPFVCSKRQLYLLDVLESIRRSGSVRLHTLLSPHNSNNMLSGSRGTQHQFYGRTTPHCQNVI